MAIGGRPKHEVCFLPGRLRWTLFPVDRYGNSFSGRGSNTQPSSWVAGTLPLSYWRPLIFICDLSDFLSRLCLFKNYILSVSFFIHSKQFTFESELRRKWFFYPSDRINLFCWQRYIKLRMFSPNSSLLKRGLFPLRLAVITSYVTTKLTAHFVAAVSG